MRNNPILCATTDIISSATLPPQNLNKNRTIARIALWEDFLYIYSLRKYTGISLYISLTPPHPYKKMSKVLKKAHFMSECVFFKLINESEAIKIFQYSKKEKKKNLFFLVFIYYAMKRIRNIEIDLRFFVVSHNFMQE